MRSFVGLGSPNGDFRAFDAGLNPEASGNCFHSLPPPPDVVFLQLSDVCILRLHILACPACQWCILGRPVGALRSPQYPRSPDSSPNHNRRACKDVSPGGSTYIELQSSEATAIGPVRAQNKTMAAGSQNITRLFPDHPLLSDLLGRYCKSAKS
jgi:hypothetical protein